MNKQERSETALRWAVFTSIAVVEALLLIKLLLESGGSRPDLLTAIVVVAVLLLLSIRVFDLKSLAYGKFRADLQRQIDDVPREGSELSQYIEVTKQGHRFLDLRRAAQATSTVGSSS